MSKCKNWNEFEGKMLFCAHLRFIFTCCLLKWTPVRIKWPWSSNRLVTGTSRMGKGQNRKISSVPIAQSNRPNVESLIWLVDDNYKVQLVYLQSTDGKVGGAEEKTDVPVTWHIFLTITTQSFLTFVPIVWFGAIHTITTVTRMGMRWPLCEYSAFNRCLHYLIGACDKRDDEWSHCIRARIEHI